MSKIGLRVGSFEIVGPATLGGADWYVGQRTEPLHRSSDRVLIRVLGPDADIDARDALQRQFQALKGFDDPRIPAAVDWHEGKSALVIEHFEGTPLQSCVEGVFNGIVEVPQATLLDILLELADTLYRVHQRGQLHGRLDARHVRIAPSGRLWILGFGVAGAAAPDWTAPELHDGGTATAHTDQWSLGALATAMLSGRPPWPAGASRDPERILQPVFQRWPALARVLRRMLATDPLERHLDLRAVRQELQALVRQTAGTSDRAALGERLRVAQVAQDDTLQGRTAPSADTYQPLNTAPRRHRRPADARPSLLGRLFGWLNPSGGRSVAAPEPEPVAPRVASVMDVDPSGETQMFPDAALAKAISELGGDETTTNVPIDEVIQAVMEQTGMRPVTQTHPTAVPGPGSAEDNAPRPYPGPSTSALGVLTPAPLSAMTPRVHTPLQRAPSAELAIDPPRRRRRVFVPLLAILAAFIAWAAVRFL